jgi:hypothetical protein
MDPISTVKSAFNVTNVIKTVATVMIAAAVLELLGFSSLLFQPIAFIKGKFGK